ncbi:MAG: hypothetical protein HRU20_08460 [Pseudomonadales bacterium]|nr:hypothetical protein [Pseudomonadales bacterium]
MFIKLMLRWGLCLLSAVISGQSLALTDPTRPPAHHGDTTQKTPANNIPTLTLQMILQKNQIAYAIINNTMVKKGDWIAGTQVIQVKNDKVIVHHQGQNIQLFLLQNQDKIQISR